MKLAAILAAASLTTAPGLSPPSSPPQDAPAVRHEQGDIVQIPPGAKGEIECQSAEGCLVVTTQFMRGYTRWIEEQAARRRCSTL